MHKHVAGTASLYLKADKYELYANEAAMVFMLMYIS